MSQTTSLGDRMKQYYEKAYDIRLPMRIPVILWLDGRAFHTVTKNFEEPFDNAFITSMNGVANYLCREIQGAQIAFIQSDEIGILLHNYKRLSSCAWFDNKIQKMVSVAASMASVKFDSYMTTHSMATFDARVFVLPEAEVCNWFIWRQRDWERNSIQMLARSLYSHKECHGKNQSDMQEMCFQKGQNWNDLPVWLRRGRCAIKNDLGIWNIDHKPPIFSKDRKYIERHLVIEEE